MKITVGKIEIETTPAQDAALESDRFNYQSGEEPTAEQWLAAKVSELLLFIEKAHASQRKQELEAELAKVSPEHHADIKAYIASKQ